MNPSNETSKDQSAISQQPFFQFFYSYNYQHNHLWKPLKDKYRNFKQQSYACPKHVNQVNYIKRFTEVCQYVPFLPQHRPQKIDIPVLQDIIEVVYDQHEQYFANGGWRAVKNKSLKTHLQEHLLLKLWRIASNTKVQGGIGNFILEFFYTLNYFKTCNYEIKLFNQFLLGSELDSFFLFIALRKKSRRVNKDLVMNSEDISAFVEALKGQRPGSSLGSFSSQHDELGQVKLLLIYPQLIEYVQNHCIVLHEVMLLSIMECAGLNNEKERITYRQPGSIDWSHFLSLCFKEQEQQQKSYQKELISRMMNINLKMADSLFKTSTQKMTLSQSIDNLKEKFLEESFGWLIGVLSSIMYGSDLCDQKLYRMYVELQMLYEYNISLGNKLIYELLKAPEYRNIYSKYQHSIQKLSNS